MFLEKSATPGRTCQVFMSQRYTASGSSEKICIDKINPTKFFQHIHFRSNSLKNMKYDSENELHFLCGHTVPTLFNHVILKEIRVS